ncbi:MAG TPA: hypothetical protein VHY79_03960 [Rhizomicrobium sp.]|jgi:hypothetical protein|nr:hypothetical protein [Rhizomicrobium sp.]
MSSDLIIKPLDFDIWEDLAAICQRHGVELPASLAGEVGDDYLLISLFDLASIEAFNAYAVGLEGIRGTDAMTKTSFRNLPWWMESFWVPLDFDAPIVENGLFIGSSVRLLGELSRIRAMSAVDIDAPPPGFAEMRAGCTDWFNRGDEPFSDDHVQQWIWNALAESGRISIEQNVPITLVP